MSVKDFRHAMSSIIATKQRFSKCEKLSGSEFSVGQLVYITQCHSFKLINLFKSILTMIYKHFVLIIITFMNHIYLFTQQMQIRT